MRRNRVHFSDEKTKHGNLDEPLKHFSQSKGISASNNSVRELWYSKLEIKEFKRHVGTLLLRSVIANGQYGVQVEEGTLIEKLHPSELWGLERLNPKRDTAKKAAIRLVLLAQLLPEGKDSEFIRSISLQCTQHARDIAVIQGYQDHCHAYRHEKESSELIVDACLLESVPMKKPWDAAPPTTPKRTASCLVFNDGHQRRVRPRASAA